MFPQLKKQNKKHKRCNQHRQLIALNLKESFKKETVKEI